MSLQTNGSEIDRKPGLLIGGGLVAGALASLCCVGPLVLTLLGISGAATLARFEFLRFPMILAVLVVFGLAGRSLLKKRHACEPGALCANPKTWRKMAATYWAGLVLALLLVGSPYLVAWIWG